MRDHLVRFFTLTGHADRFHVAQIPLLCCSSPLDRAAIADTTPDGSLGSHNVLGSRV